MEGLEVSEILARVLHDEYLRDAFDIAKLSPEELNKITGISIEDCARIIEKARDLAKKAKKEDKIELLYHCVTNDGKILGVVS